MTIHREFPRFTGTVPVLIILLFSHGLSAANIEHENIFSTGQQYYQSGNYEKALVAFEEAVQMEPDNSMYHHWLGKCYGRMAEASGILKAYELSKKTRLQLERAVELDDTNIDALSDLMKYYRQAPGFLGGGADKADAICRRIQEIRENGPAGTGPAQASEPVKC